MMYENVLEGNMTADVIAMHIYDRLLMDRGESESLYPLQMYVLPEDVGRDIPLNTLRVTRSCL